MSSEIQRRKSDHLDLCATDDVKFRGVTTLLHDVRLIHQSLPDLKLDSIDTTTKLLGKTLRAPIVIAAMTGGTERAAQINHELAEIAELRGYALGLGSQRAMERNPETTWTYQVRHTAPTALIFGNIGVVQARDLPTNALQSMISDIGADALCVHMNPAMELIQTEGDTDFERGTETFARLVRELSVPVIAKETGCGISAQTARKLSNIGVRVVDVSGAGGTSWVGVETLRTHEEHAAKLGALLWDWGVPTAASIVFATRYGMTTIGTGGIASGLDVARAIALGATATGVARPVLQALSDGGRNAVEQLLDQIERELKTIMLLCGARTIRDLQKVPKLIVGELNAWLAQ